MGNRKQLGQSVSEIRKAKNEKKKKTKWGKGGEVVT